MNPWLRALELTAPIGRDPRRLLASVIDERAAQHGDAPALLSDRECFSFRDLAARATQYARWALDQGIGRGDVVGLFMPNRPEYLAIWLGITRIGGVVALLNTHLTGAALAHCVNLVSPRHLVADARLVEALLTARPDLTGSAKLWIHGATLDAVPSLDAEVARFAAAPLRGTECRPVTLEDRALYLYTSGTTGRPKAANVSHFRLMQWSHWFAGLMGSAPADRMYDCLPMYHSVGGVIATGAPLVTGGSVVIAEKFSAATFWADVVRWECTLVQYIGELCRYLLRTPPDPHDTGHHVRLACGNGLAPDVWRAFERRFRIPRILEFYASTEGNVSLFNVDGKPGALGRIPAFLAHRAPMALVKVDGERETPLRDRDGRCVRCAAGEVGEAIGEVRNDGATVGTRFEGYTSAIDTETKVLRDVFQPGDAWFRTGDLMRRDSEGDHHFVDRIGDTFRWTGENVATADVASALGAFPAIADAVVYGVAVPGADGRAGMAAIVCDGPLDLAALRAHLCATLPGYARPRFLRVRAALDVTGTFKHTKQALVRQGYDPRATDDPLYVVAPEGDTFVRLDEPLYDRLQRGELRL